MKTFHQKVYDSPDKVFVLPADDPTVEHVRKGLALFVSSVEGAGVGVKTLLAIESDKYVATFTGAWSFHADVDRDIYNEQGVLQSFRCDPCVKSYAASFGEVDTKFVDSASMGPNGLRGAMAHRIMCIARHDRAGSDAERQPRVLYNPADVTTPADVGALFNHAQKSDKASNCSFLPCIVKTPDGMRLALVISTTRPVRAGEELRWDYTWDASAETELATPDPVEEAETFDVVKHTMPWTADLKDAEGFKKSTLDFYLGNGYKMAIDWSMQQQQSQRSQQPREPVAAPPEWFKSKWCGPPVSLVTLPTGISAAMVVTQDAGEAHRRGLPGRVMVDPSTPPSPQ